MEVNLETLRSFCKDGGIIWTDHTVKRMFQHGIYRRQVTDAIENGEIIEQYPDDYPHPSCLILGWDETGDPVHVVAGLGEAAVWIITTYYPDPEKWESDWKTRREPK